MHYFDMGEIYSIRGGVWVDVSAEHLRLRSAKDIGLYRSIRAGEVNQLWPQLSSEQALERAQEYLGQFRLNDDPNVRLKVLSFNYGSSNSCWEVRWQRCWNGYLLDDFTGLPETIYVIFHEKLGIQAIGTTLNSPPPQSFEVNIAREDAVVKASVLTNNVTRTPYYRMARAGGFKAAGLKSCELKIVKPNWLLDPKRAIWIREKPAEETRLCWVVVFSTADTVPETRGKTTEGNLLKPIPPDIIIYLDAATGECVGANFS